MNPADLERAFASLVLQLSVIIAASRLLGVLFRRLHQPHVIGEILAGILLGPSLLGWVAPATYAFLFPADSLPFLKVLSECGIVLFMFLIGLELDPALLRGHGRTTLVVSLASVAVPLALGFSFGYAAHERLSPPEIPRALFALFIGVGMAVTAFPVLARILIEQSLLKTRIGALAMATAAVNDVAGWCLLSVVVALVHAGNPSAAYATFALVLLYLAVMSLAVRPLLVRLLALFESRGALSQNQLAVLLLLVLLSALATHEIGIHAIFGAFVLGAVLPKRGGLTAAIASRTNDFVTVFFLPIYFAHTGLRTQMFLLGDPSLLLDCVLLTAIAVVGKLGGGFLSARAMGLEWRESAALGVLLNTRGLMELVLLNVALDLGVITPSVFAAMVVMALATTLMTNPGLRWIYRGERLRAAFSGAAVPASRGDGAVLVPIALASSGPRLVDLAAALAPTAASRIYVLHVARPPEGASFGQAGDLADPRADRALQPALEHAERLGIGLHAVVLASTNPAEDIADVARAKGATLVVMGWHKPVFSRSFLGGTVERAMRRTGADVAVFVDRGLPASIRRVLVPYRTTRHDRLALQLAAKLARTHRADVKILHIATRRTDLESAALRDLTAATFAEPETGTATTLEIVSPDDPVEVILEQASGYDLTVIGVGEEWGVAPHVFGLRPERLAAACPTSLLIVRAGTGEPGH